MNNFKPLARRQGIVTAPVNDELLIYTSENKMGHALNRTARLVWEQCDGAHTVLEIATELSNSTLAPISEDVVWYALAQLEKQDLLVKTSANIVTFPQLTRREFLGKAAIATAFVPIVKVLKVSDQNFHPTS